MGRNGLIFLFQPDGGRWVFCHLFGQKKVAPKLTGFTDAYNSVDSHFVFILTRPDKSGLKQKNKLLLNSSRSSD
jgi:hypothetical protein